MTQPNRRRRSGAAAMELALILPFLGLMFTAAVDFARVFQATQVLEASAWAGAMYASGTAQTTSEVGPTQAATNAACASGVSLTPALQSANVTVTLDSNAATATVSVTYTFQLVTPVMGPGGQVQLTRTVIMNLAPTPGS